ncbi:MAG: H-NS histone family protein [Polaromonas sp.]|nr:H-NS histone family protein [Polaromonas sp.]
MSNLIDIQGKIEQLQKQASEIRNKEFDKTVQDIRATMQAFGITAKDLQATGKGRGAKRGAKPGTKPAIKRAAAGGAKQKSGAVVAAKYRGPNGETWSGRGLSPRWLTALVAEGKTREDFAVKV